MSAMHHDTSYDLKVVRDILKNILEVYLSLRLSRVTIGVKPYQIDFT